MKNIYFSLWYRCNQRCLACPCINVSNKEKILTFRDVVETLDSVLAKNNGEKVSVTLSGGEPTLHPDFIKIVNYLTQNNVYLTILTNAEKFSNRLFADQFVNQISIFNTHVITTIHSNRIKLHESQNLRPGSFKRSTNGLQYLFQKGLHITVKHCITSVNYKEIEEFIRWADKFFHPSVDIQLFGTDYCGLKKEEAEKFFVPFKEMGLYLEKGLDAFLEINARNGRVISINNLPLCSVDPYYWNLFPRRNKNKKTGYDTYVDPTTSKDDFIDDSSTGSIHCTACYVRDICEGTYNSAFMFFGDDIVTSINAAKTNNTKN
jgi:MoaA/NifB/PqqE/SkfB family radical SAM enzyme